MRLFKKEPIFRVETRSNIRINERFPVTWRMKDKDIKGTAKVRNISETGMMLKAGEEAIFLKDSILAFEIPKKGQIDFLPNFGRMIWSRRKSPGSSRCLCGIEFVDPAQEIVIRLREKIKDKVTRLKNAQEVNNRVGIVLFAIMATLLVFFFIQQALMNRNIEKSNHMMLSNAGKQSALYSDVLGRSIIQESVLKEISKDLNTTKALLVQAETMLAGIKDKDNTIINDLNSRVSALQKSSQDLTKELSITKERIRAFDGDAESLGEAKASIALHKRRIRKIKSRMHGLKRQAYLAKVAAQKEHDRIALANGNQGYIIKDSKPFRPALGTSPQRKIEIDISLVE